MLTCTVLGCFSPNFCETADPCPPPPATDGCEGGCVPYLGGAWAPVLVAQSSPRPSCPKEAPWETMGSEAPPITACGVQEADGECSSAGDVCLPAELGWTACVLRDGAHPCPWPYEQRVDQPDPTTTLCCPSDEPPP